MAIGAAGVPLPNDPLDQFPEVNWNLLERLAVKPHKHLNIVEGEQYGLLIDGKFHDASNGVGEVMQEARTVQHLCDFGGVPEGTEYKAHIDARVFLLLAKMTELGDRLDRIITWHSQETGEAGTVSGYCKECGQPWPCETRQMAEGTYVDQIDET